MKTKIDIKKSKETFFKYSMFASKEDMENEQKINKHKLHLKLVQALKTGDFNAIQKYVSNLFINDLAPCPLVTSIHSLRLDVIKSVETKLKGKLFEAWGKCDIESLIDGLNSQKPSLLPENAVFCDLGEWYYKHRNAIWCAQYDVELLNMTNCEQWSIGLSDWEHRLLLDTTAIIPHRRCNTLVDSDDKNCLSIPPLFAHQRAVKKIENNICAVIEYLHQIKRQLSTMSKQCGAECGEFQSGNKSCVLNQEPQDIEELRVCGVGFL